MAQDDAEAITERALTRVLGYVDPVAHALATKAAARDETTIAAALKTIQNNQNANENNKFAVTAIGNVHDFVDMFKNKI